MRIMDQLNGAASIGVGMPRAPLPPGRPVPIYQRTETQKVLEDLESRLRDIRLARGSRMSDASATKAAADTVVAAPMQVNSTQWGPRGDVL